jgi:hypothetical protein
MNPTATLNDVKLGCNINVTIVTSIGKYLKRFGMPRTVAKKKIVVSDINKQKRVNFCKLMLSKSEEELASIWFSAKVV